MAKLTLLPDPRYTSSETAPVVIRISHLRKVNYIKTGYFVKSAYWSDKQSQFKSTYPNSVKANARVQKRLALAQEILSEHSAILPSMTSKQITSIIRNRFEELDESKLPKQITIQQTGLLSYGQMVIDRYKKANRFGMARSFEDCLKFFRRYHDGQDILLTDIDTTYLEDLEADYLGRGLKINGLSTYLRSVRRFFNLAIRDKATEVNETHYPFGRGGYSIRREKARKRAVKLDVIKALRELEIPEDSGLWHHRNYFLFMFNMRGMNFIDLSFLSKANLYEDRIRYKRHKTKRGQSTREFNIKLTAEAQRILDYYANKESDLLFPILRDVIDSKDKKLIYDTYMSRLCNHNRRLRSIGKELGLTEPLTTYVARHTFATAGLHKGISKAQIGDMLGHANYNTTEAYFEEFDTEVLDQAAEIILED
jgi:site-specific recombinase XerD